MSRAEKILIVGATGVLGGAIARTLAGPGRAIALHAHAASAKAETLAAELAGAGAKTVVLGGDLARVDEAIRLGNEAFEKLGGLDLLVHAAARFEKTPLGTVTEEQWDALLDLDLKGAFFLAQELGIRMQHTGGKMIFLSDVAAARPYAGYLPYCIAKAGIDALVRGLAKSLAPKVLVNGVAPYVVTRPAGLSDRGWDDLLLKMPAKRAQTPEEIAAIVAMLAANDAMTGQIIAADGGRLLR